MADDERESSETGVEPEDTRSELVPPFDTSKIRVRMWQPTIDLLIKRMEDNAIDLAPDFQRRAGIWSEKAQSQLIESIMMRIPLPAFFIDGIDEERMAVIDGIQRLTALRRFILLKNLRLTGLEFLTDLENKNFDDLPRSLQRRILETQITVNIIEKGTPERAKLNLYKRINRGGITLNAQEIRHAINPGPVRAFLEALAESDEFKTATGHGVRPDRMDDRECVLRFIAFLRSPPDRYMAEELDTFLNEGMHSINAMSDTDRTEVARRFRRAMLAASRILAEKAFRKTLGRRGPINKALFEAWSVNLDGLTDAQILVLTDRSARVSHEFDLLQQKPDFMKAISEATGDQKRVQLRFREIRSLLERVLA